VKASRSWLAPAFIAAWGILGLMLAFFDRVLWDRLWILTLGLWALYILLGVLLLAASLWRLRRNRSRQGVLTALAVPVLAVILWFAIPPTASAGDDIQFARRFSRLESRYLAIINGPTSEAQAVERGTSGGVDFVLDFGPPLRVAFPQRGGITDNWEAVVHDPSGRVREAVGWKNGVAGEFTASPEVRSLFGGDLLACRHVVEHFYRCWFT
jgi:hypothetical protein